MELQQYCSSMVGRRSSGLYIKTRTDIYDAFTSSVSSALIKLRQHYSIETLPQIMVSEGCEDAD